MKYCWKNKLSIVCSLFFAANINADALHSLDNIEQVVYEYALSHAQENFDNPQIEMGTLDSRLRLQACEHHLDIFNNREGTGVGNQTIGVKCSSPVAWTVYVPVKVKVLQAVVVAARPLAANQLITAKDVKLKQLDIGALRQGYVNNIRKIVGQQLKYPVALGTVIKPRSVQAQKLVRRGEHIMLVALAGNMEVRMSGTALSDAILGQRIRVKNSSSKRVVEGVVEAAGIVKVTM